jgi:F-type H+-transporting ATPase subunit delta
VSAFAQSYARAFLETAPARYDVSGFLERAGSLAKAIAENATLRAFLSAPAVPQTAKAKALKALGEKAGLDEMGIRFFEVMLRHHRLLEAEEILRRLREANDARNGIVEGTVTVAAPIGEPERKAIEEALSGRVGGRVRLQTRIDPAILAGFVAHVGSNVFDASVLTAIRRFRDEASSRTGV